MNDTEQRGSDVLAISDSLVSLGSEVRQLRRARQMTLKDMARASGVSLSYLSAIERGSSNPSVEIIERIANALGVSAGWFFARRPGKGPMERAHVVRRRNRRELNILYGEATAALGLSDQLLSSSIGGDFLMGMATYEPHSSRPEHPMYQHEGEQHGFILSGELELQIDDELIVLCEGDSYSFPTHIVHNARNVTDWPCKLIWAISPIVIPKDVVVRDQIDEPAAQSGHRR